MNEIVLKTFSLSDEAFNKILETCSDYVIEVKDISKYLHGSLCKTSIFYDGSKKMVLLQKRLENIGKPCDNNWKQCICIRNIKQEESWRDSINGGTAWTRMIKLLKKKYTELEIEERFSLFTRPYDPRFNQLHINYLPGNKAGIVHEFPDCFKYDINGAYAKALCEIFPKAKSEILKLYNERKIKPENKELINYFVGMMCVKSYRETFNWIVQNVRKQMEETIEELNGVVLYANTDGFVIHAAEKQLNYSTALGDFKLEYHGTAYIYASTNYWCIQCGDEITGTCLQCVRKQMNLAEGSVVDYRRKKEGCVMKAVDIVERKVKVIQHGKKKD